MKVQRLCPPDFPQNQAAMKQVDEIIYDAISADTDLMEAIGGRVVSTCFEVPPYDIDNTQTPYIIVHDSGFFNQQTTKDNLWESEEDQVTTTVEVAADSPGEVKQIVRKIRAAVASYISTMYANGSEVPELQSLNSDGIDWDWMKPCYYQHLNYQCITNADNTDEQEEE